MSTTNNNSLCETATFPVLGCPIPTDGIGSSCYTVPFAIPVCPTYYAAAAAAMRNLSNSHSPPLTNYTTFQTLDETFYGPRASSLLVASMGLAISVLTLCNVLVLTPARKLGKPIHTAVLVGLLAEIVGRGCDVHLYTAGPTVSSYLLLTGDWASTRFSGMYRGAMAGRFVGLVVAFACVQVALAVQGFALCTWVKVKFGKTWYYGVLGVLMLAGFVAWSLTAAFAGYQIFWLAFVKEGTYLPAVFEGAWWKWLSGGYRISVCLSFGLWCLCFGVGAWLVLWERRLMFCDVGSGGTGRSGRSEGTMLGLTGRRNKAQHAYGIALRLIGAVGVASFILPIVVCFLNVVWRTIPLLESLAQSLILALLPVSTLFLVDGSPMESKERFVASGSGVGDRHGRCECLPEINQRSVHHLNDSVHGPAELEGKSTKSSGWDSNAWNGGRLPQGQFERELQEIDRM